MSKKRTSWYLSDVKTKQNRTWTTEEKLQIYNLRQHKTVAEVTEMFDVSSTQVYNITRIVKNGLEGKCYHCGNPVEQTVLDREKIEERAYEIYVRTGSRDAVANWQEAESELRLESSISKLCEHCKKALVGYKRKLRVRALKNGLCGYCHKRKVVKGKKACTKCLSATHRRREKQGLCGACGKHPIAHENGALCSGCLEKDRVNIALYRKEKRVLTNAN